MAIEGVVLYLESIILAIVGPTMIIVEMTITRCTKTPSHQIWKTFSSKFTILEEGLFHGTLPQPFIVTDGCIKIPKKVDMRRGRCTCLLHSFGTIAALAHLA